MGPSPAKPREASAAAGSNKVMEVRDLTYKQRNEQYQKCQRKRLADASAQPAAQPAVSVGSSVPADPLHD